MDLMPRPQHGLVREGAPPSAWAGPGGCEESDFYSLTYIQEPGHQVWVPAPDNEGGISQSDYSGACSTGYIP